MGQDSWQNKRDSQSSQRWNKKSPGQLGIRSEIDSIIKVDFKMEIVIKKHYSSKVFILFFFFFFFVFF
jgi:hypothetical protein